MTNIQHSFQFPENFIDNTEIWKPIPGWDNEYFASNLGRIKKIKTKFKLGYNEHESIERILKPGNGRKATTVHIGKHKRCRIRESISRLTYSAFFNENIEKYQVKHKDKNPLNNNIENLFLKPKSIIKPNNNHLFLNKKFDNIFITEIKQKTCIAKCDCGIIFKISKATILERTRLSKHIACNHLCKSIAKERKNSAKKQLFKSYHRNAIKRGYEFNIPVDEFNKIIKLNCFYCNRKPSNQSDFLDNGEYLKYSGIDRVDNKKGYIMSNIVPCCSICNMSKMRLPYKEWIEWIYAISYRKNIVKSFIETLEGDNPI